MTIKIITGWIATMLAILSILPSLIPGVLSLIGLVTALISLLLSLISVSSSSKLYFQICLSLVIVNILLLNDSFRLVGSLPEIPMIFKVVAYGISSIIVLGCYITVNKIYSAAEKSDY